VEELDHLVLAVTSVDFPAMRRDVMGSLAALSDPAHQESWIPGARTGDDLSWHVHVLYDDCQVLPDPETRLGTVLVAGPEVERLRALDRALGPLIDEWGDVPDVVYLGDSRWPQVVRAAGAALSAIVLAGGYVEP
jgi:hypothetical protein